jgi:hypothetical protein
MREAVVEAVLAFIGERVRPVVKHSPDDTAPPEAWDRTLIEERERSADGMGGRLRRAWLWDAQGVREISPDQVEELWKEVSDSISFPCDLYSFAVWEDLTHVDYFFGFDILGLRGFRLLVTERDGGVYLDIDPEGRIWMT